MKAWHQTHNKNSQRVWLLNTLISIKHENEWTIFPKNFVEQSIFLTERVIYINHSTNLK